MPHRIAAATGLDPVELRALHGMLLRLTDRLDSAEDIRGECDGAERE